MPPIWFSRLVRANLIVNWPRWRRSSPFSIRSSRSTLSTGNTLWRVSTSSPTPSPWQRTGKQWPSSARNSSPSVIVMEWKSTAKKIIRSFWPWSLFSIKYCTTRISKARQWISPRRSIEEFSFLYVATINLKNTTLRIREHETLNVVYSVSVFSRHERQKLSIKVTFSRGKNEPIGRIIPVAVKRIRFSQGIWLTYLSTDMSVLDKYMFHRRSKVSSSLLQRLTCPRQSRCAVASILTLSESDRTLAKLKERFSFSRQSLDVFAHSFTNR